jgi:hypothetical protein
MARRPSNRARAESASLAKRIAAAKRQLQPVLPDMDPGDLDLILSSLLRPFGSGRYFFLREVRPGVRVF